MGLAKRLRDYGLALAALVGLLVFWELLCRFAKIPMWLLPAPSMVVAALREWLHLLPVHFAATLTAVVGGFLLALAVGIPTAVAVVYSPFLRRVIYPVLVTLQSVPKVALAPLLLIWVGYGLPSNILISAIVAFFPIVINTAAGLDSVEPELLDLTRSYDASTMKVFWKVRLPSALPFILSAMKIAISLSVIGAVVGEFVGADKGLGYLIVNASSTMNTALVFGVILVLSLLGIMCFYLIAFLENLIASRYLYRATAQQE
jgi:NitT/TauT family transport system permease protein